MRFLRRVPGSSDQDAGRAPSGGGSRQVLEGGASQTGQHAEESQEPDGHTQRAEEVEEHKSQKLITDVKFAFHVQTRQQEIVQNIQARGGAWVEGKVQENVQSNNVRSSVHVRKRLKKEKGCEGLEDEIKKSLCRATHRTCVVGDCVI